MKQKSKKIIGISLIAIIIIIASVIVVKRGFNKELRYAQSQKIDINVEQKVDQSKIKKIADEVLGMHYMLQTVEIYEDVITIRANTISEQQKNDIVNKIKEIYEFEQTAEKTSISTIPATRFRDMYKKYIIPFAISEILIVTYLVIKYHKKGILKVVTTSILYPLIAQLLLFSWIAIVRIPVGRFIPMFVILVYVISIWCTISKFEN